MYSIDSTFWKEAVESEIDSIMSKSSFDFGGFTIWIKPICYKWICKKKLRTEVSVEKFKARFTGKCPFGKD